MTAVMQVTHGQASVNDCVYGQEIFLSDHFIIIATLETDYDN